jgi:hypothetical protein
MMCGMHSAVRRGGVCQEERERERNAAESAPRRPPGAVYTATLAKGGPVRHRDTPPRLPWTAETCNAAERRPAPGKLKEPWAR